MKSGARIASESVAKFDEAHAFIVRSEEIWWEEWATRSLEVAASAARKSLERREQAVIATCSAPNVGRFPSRCRRCASCLKRRAREWVARAKQEFFASEKAWWVTLTIRPGEEGTAYKEIQDWVKRLRKGGTVVTVKGKSVRLPAASVRYVCSEETGEKNGRLHWHLLLLGDLTQKHLDSWPHGFVHRRLARGVGLVAYMAKYLGKVGRIRASVGFGKPDKCLLKARPDLYAEYHRWLFGSGLRPDFVVVFGSLISHHRIGAWWLVPPF